MFLEYELGTILRAAKFCGDCGRNFNDVADDYCYVRIRPARLICQDCKLKEREQQGEHAGDRK